MNGQFWVEVVVAAPKNICFQQVRGDFQDEPRRDNDNTKRCKDLPALGETQRAKAVRMNIDGVYSYI